MREEESEFGNILSNNQQELVCDFEFSMAEVRRKFEDFIQLASMSTENDQNYQDLTSEDSYKKDEFVNQVKDFVEHDHQIDVDCFQYNKQMDQFRDFNHNNYWKIKMQYKIDDILEESLIR